MLASSLWFGSVSTGPPRHLEPGISSQVWFHCCLQSRSESVIVQIDLLLRWISAGWVFCLVILLWNLWDSGRTRLSAAVKQTWQTSTCFHMECGEREAADVLSSKPVISCIMWMTSVTSVNNWSVKQTDCTGAGPLLRPPAPASGLLPPVGLCTCSPTAADGGQSEQLPLSCEAETEAEPLLLLCQRLKSKLRTDSPARASLLEMLVSTWWWNYWLYKKQIWSKAAEKQTENSTSVSVRHYVHCTYRYT